MKLLSYVRLLVTLWTAAYQSSLSIGFSRQEYCSGVPLPSPNCLRTPNNYIFGIAPLARHSSLGVIEKE